MNDNEQINKLSKSTINDNIQGGDINSPILLSVENVEITAQELKKTTKIRGWLTFFLIWVGFGGLVSFVYTLATSNYDTSDPIYYVASMLDILYAFFYLLVSIYVIYVFIARRPNAVFVTYAYLIYHIVLNIMMLCIGEFEESGIGSFPQIIKSTIWNIIWIIYIFVSKQVKKIIPKSYRKYQKINTWMIVLMILIPLIAYVGAFSFAYNYTNSEFTEYGSDVSQVEPQNSIDELSLGANEYTDGTIIFECPTGMSCESQFVDDSLKFHQLSAENREITLLSDYDNDCSNDNFVEYWNTGRDNILGDYYWSIIKNEIDTLTMDRILYHRVVKAEVDESNIYWQFVMLFDKNTDKVAIISAYDNDYNDEYITELVTSIKFNN